jgi:hypothetical protein
MYDEMHGLTGNLLNLAETVMRLRQRAAGIASAKDFRELMACAETMLRDTMDVVSRANATAFGLDCAGASSSPVTSPKSPVTPPRPLRGR